MSANLPTSSDMMASEFFDRSKRLENNNDELNIWRGTVNEKIENRIRSQEDVFVQRFFDRKYNFSLRKLREAKALDNLVILITSSNGFGKNIMLEQELGRHLEKIIIIENEIRLNREAAKTVFDWYMNRSEIFSYYERTENSLLNPLRLSELAVAEVQLSISHNNNVDPVQFGKVADSWSKHCADIFNASTSSGLSTPDSIENEEWCTRKEELFDQIYNCITVPWFRRFTHAVHRGVHVDIAAFNDRLSAYQHDVRSKIERLEELLGDLVRYH